MHHAWTTLYDVWGIYEVWEDVWGKVRECHTEVCDKMWGSALDKSVGGITVTIWSS